MARLTAGEREREREVQRYRVTGRTADCRQTTKSKTANEDHHLRILHLHNRFLTVTSSVATGLEYVFSRYIVRRRLRQHGILSTIQRDDIYEATLTSPFTLGTSVSTLEISELATYTRFR